MFTHYRTRGFILKKEERGEADRIFTIFTENFGKLELLAKGERKIKSKLRGGLETFYLSEIEFIQGKAYKTLTDTILINNFKNLRKDLKKLAVALKISATLDSLVKGEEPDKKIWRLLEEIFDKLNDLQFKIYDLRLIYYLFFWNLISILGYQLDFYHCSQCQKKLSPEKIFFNPREGGLICTQCAVKLKNPKPIETDIIKIIRILIEKKWSTLTKLKVEEKDLRKLSETSEYYFSEVLEQIE